MSQNIPAGVHGNQILFVSLSAQSMKRTPTLRPVRTKSMTVRFLLSLRFRFLPPFFPVGFYRRNTDDTRIPTHLSYLFMSRHDKSQLPAERHHDETSISYADGSAFAASPSVPVIMQSPPAPCRLPPSWTLLHHDEYRSSLRKKALSRNKGLPLHRPKNTSPHPFRKRAPPQKPLPRRYAACLPVLKI